MYKPICSYDFIDTMDLYDRFRDLIYSETGFSIAERDLIELC